MQAPDLHREVAARAAELGGLIAQAIEAAFVHEGGGTFARIDRLLGRLDDEPDPRQRREILEQVARLFERELADPDRALTSLLEAYWEMPARDAWWDLDRLAGVTGRWMDLAGELEVAIPRLPEGDRADGWTRLASLRAEHLGAVDDALVAFAAALGGDPDHREAHQRRLELLRGLGRWMELADALAVLAERENPAAAARLHLERAAVHEKTGDSVAAASAYRDALAADASCEDARRALEGAVRRQASVPELIRFLGERLARAAVEEQPAIRRELAGLCAGNGDRAGAILHWEEVLAGGPDDVEALRALDPLYGEDGRVTDQLHTLTALVGVVVDGGERASLYRRMFALWSEQAGAAQHAEECLEWLVAYDDAADDETFHALARSYRAGGRLRPAMDVMTRHAAATRSTAVRAELYRQLAEIQERELHDDARAIEFWEKAERELADPAAARRALARLYARSETFDSERASSMLERAIASGGADVGALLALARIRRLERRAAPGAELARQALAAAGDVVERARALTELGRCQEDMDLTGDAIASYVQAVALDGEQDEARERAADLLWSERRYGELLPLQERLAGDATNARVRQSRLTRLARAANAVSATVKLSGSEVALAALAAEEAEIGLGLEDCVEVRCQLGLIAMGAGRSGTAREQLEAAAAIDPYHRATHVALVELDGYVPAALAHLDGVELVAADHKLLHRLLDACEAEKAWDAALAVLARLIGIETVAATRGRYRLAAGAVCHEALGRDEDALGFLNAALDDDPELERAAAEMEAILRARGDQAGLLALHMRRLGHLGAESGDGRKPERLRLWSAVADLCLKEIGDRQSGITALEVAVELDGEDVGRRARLAALYVEAGAEGQAQQRAIAEYQALLRLDKGRVEAYRALERLYRETWQFERADACGRAAAVLSGEVVPPVAHPAAIERSLDAELWGRLRHPDEDRLLDVLFTTVTPALAAAHARARRPAPFRRGTIPPGDGRVCSRAYARVVAAFGLALPSSYPRPDLGVPVTFRPRVIGDHLVAEVLLGAPLLDAVSEAEASVDLALALAHLRPERFARVLVTDAGALAHVVDAAIAMSGKARADAAPSGVTATLDLLRQTLSPVALDQVATVGGRLHERGIGGAAAARGWLAATELTAARAALLVADLPSCVRRLEAAGTDRARIVDVVWSSVTDELAEIRQQLAAAPLLNAVPARSSAR